MDSIFQVHMLNNLGKAKANDLAEAFDELLGVVTGIVNADNIANVGNKGARELAIVRTKLEEACFFAKKAMANQIVNQELSALELGATARDAGIVR